MRHQGIEEEIGLEPEVIFPDYRESGTPEGKTVRLTGADNGIGRTVILEYAQGGADVAIAYIDEHVASFGSNIPLRRAGLPGEGASSFVRAARDVSYISGQTLYPNDGQVVKA